MNAVDKVRIYSKQGDSESQQQQQEKKYNEEIESDVVQTKNIVN